MRALALALLLPFTTYGQGMAYLPQWTMVDGRACYDFEGAKRLVLLDAAYDTCLDNSRVQLRMISELEEIRALQDAQVKAQAEIITEYQQRDAKLTQDLKDAVAARHKAEANSSPGMGWTVAGVIALVFTGAVVGYLVRDKTKD